MTFWKLRSNEQTEKMRLNLFIQAGLQPTRIPQKVAQIEIKRGRVWLSHLGSPTDIILSQGQSYQLPRHHRALITADSDAIIEIIEA